MSRDENDPLDLAERLAASLPDAPVDPLADVMAGDSTPAGYWDHTSGDRGCGAASRFICTRAAGHPGQHIATAGIAGVVEVWTS